MKNCYYGIREDLNILMNGNILLKNGILDEKFMKIAKKIGRVMEFSMSVSEGN